MDNMLVKDYISDALFKLMEKEPYANINITKLVKEAGVCRKSFYRNYNSMEEILIKKIESITDEFIIKSDLANYKNNFKIKMVKVLNHMKEQDKIVKLYLKNNLLYIIENNFIDTILKFNNDLPNEDAHFLAGGYWYLYYYWLKNGYKETPEELAFNIDKYLKINI